MGGKRVNINERIGSVGLNKHGSKMVVEEYNNHYDIWVRFVNSDERAHTTWQTFREGRVKSYYDRTVQGVGYIGKGDYKSTENGKNTPQYNLWLRMLRRCYHEETLYEQQTYIGCSVIREWHNFQNFAKWYDQNYYEIDGEKIHLDKDILVKGNKVYSPDTCVFAPQDINFLFIKSNNSRGKYPIGVSFNTSTNKFIVHCCDGEGKNIYLGQFYTPTEAFKKYKEFKESVIKKVANNYKDKIPSKLYNAMIDYKVEIQD